MVPWRRLRPVLVRERPHERAQHLGQEAVVAAGLADRVTDVLLVDPALGKVTGQVEPARYRAGAGPADVARLVHIGRGEVLRDLLARPGHQVPHNAGAQPGRPVDPALVLRVERGDELAVVPAGIQQPGGIVVAVPGEPAEVVIEQVQRDVLHRPVASFGRRRPAGVPERAEQREKIGSLTGEQRPDIPDRSLGKSHLTILPAGCFDPGCGYLLTFDCRCKRKLVAGNGPAFVALIGLPEGRGCCWRSRA